MRILDQRVVAWGLGESTFRPLYLQVRGGAKTNDDNYT